MFVHEQGDDLYLGQAIPRYWLNQDRAVGIERAATYFGPISLSIQPNTDKSEITAVLLPPERNRPSNIYVRLRHPDAKPIQSVTLNGKPYERFNVEKEWVILPGTAEGQQEILVQY